MGSLSEAYVRQGIDIGVERGRVEGIEEGMEKGTLRSIHQIMKNSGMSADEAMDLLGIPESERSYYKSKL